MAVKTRIYQRYFEDFLLFWAVVMCILLLIGEGILLTRGKDRKLVIKHKLLQTTREEHTIP
jgi:hypothetical protein